MDEDGSIAAAPPEIWADDCLGRQDDADLLIQFLLGRTEERADRGRPRSYVLNIDARWGQGKTFFLERLQKQLSETGFLVCYVNAWRDDHADDPMIAVMSAIDEAIKPFIGKRKAQQKLYSAVRHNLGNIAIATTKSLAKTGIRRIIGSEGFNEISELIAQPYSLESNETGNGSNGAENSALQGDTDHSTVGGQMSQELEKIVDMAGDALIAGFREESNSIEDFRRSLSNIIADIGKKNGKNLPMFILIDELDRCRPLYAVKLLERVKHLFEVNNTIFIVATDSEQLQHSIRVIYGEGFEGRRYLKRFFDRSYSFSDPTIDKFVRNLFRSNPIESDKISLPPGVKVEDAFMGAALAQKMELRDLEQCFDLLRGIVTIWKYTVPIEITYMLPLIFCHHSSNKEAFDELILFGRKARKKYFVGNGRSIGVLNESLVKIIIMLNSSMIAFLNEFVAKDDVDRWLKNRIENEYRNRSGKNDFIGVANLSVMRVYPSLVSSLARFDDGD
ncbi:MAG: KAP family NTPase [Alphaproteobacteria bacterium]|nr:KAP family NTPase [Alphaproteobacteria bacterium]